MANSQIKHAIGTFSNRADAEQALSQLKDAGFSMSKVSVIAKDAGRNDQLGGADITNHAGEGARVGVIAGGTTGSIVGLIEGLAVLAIPGVGPAVAAGAVLANTLLSGGIGAAVGGLGGALIGWGIPQKQAKFYQDRVSQGDYLVVVQGTEDEIARAEAVLNHRGIQQWNVYDAPRHFDNPQIRVISRQPGID